VTSTCITLTHMQAKQPRQAQLLLAGDGGISRVAGALIYLTLPKWALKIMQFKDLIGACVSCSRLCHADDADRDVCFCAAVPA